MLYAGRSIKPELGTSKTLGPLTLELAASVSLYTDNTNFLDGRTLSQDPIYASQDNHNREGRVYKTKMMIGLLNVAVLSIGMHGAYAMDPMERHRLEKKLHAEHKAEWGYAGKTGPEHWGEISSKYEMCAEGKNQSPIDLADFTDADLPPIEFSYSSDAKEIVNNGRSVQANYAAGSSISVDGHEFALLQFHFHSPSENHIK